MQVKTLIENLQRFYKPEDEIFVEYWDKGTVEGYGTSRPMTDEEWVAVVETMEQGEFYHQSLAAEQLVETAEEEMAR